ncbi:MAG TPA: DUF1330 domain-containing protein [Phenylobacterium sp.]|jgi:uncharacterized protein (DUF1330 family)
MSAYVLAQITVRDREVYGRYAAAFLPTLIPYQGRLLAADEAPEVMEGDWPHRKVVLIAFPDAAAARAWADGPEYMAIVGDRLAASDGVALLVQGLGP